MNCPHSHIIEQRTPDRPHYAKEVCATCGSFRRWVPKPETLERQAENGRRIVSLRQRADLDDWTRSFIDSLDGQGPKLSPKQQAKLDEIWTRQNKSHKARK